MLVSLRTCAELTTLKNLPVWMLEAASSPSEPLGPKTSSGPEAICMCVSQGSPDSQTPLLATGLRLASQLSCAHLSGSAGRCKFPAHLHDQRVVLLSSIRRSRHRLVGIEVAAVVAYLRVYTRFRSLKASIPSQTCRVLARTMQLVVFALVVRAFLADAETWGGTGPRTNGSPNTQACLRHPKSPESRK